MDKVIIYISDWIILLPLFVGVAILKKIHFDSKLILLVVVAGTVPQMIHFFLNHSTALNITYNIYPPIEFITFYILFFKKIVKEKNKLFFVFSFFFNESACIYLLIKNGISNHFISELVLLNNFIYLLWIGLYLYESFKFDKEELKTTNPFFWYTVGILLYASCASVVYIFWQRILNNPSSILKYLWNIQNVFNITMYLLFTTGLWIDNKSFKNINHYK